jgi:lipopolysaccharide assembly outer membrane protein LptD (OstA)
LVWLACAALCAQVAHIAHAQEATPDTASADSAAAPIDTTAAPVIAAPVAADTLVAAPSDLTAPLSFSARDSLVLVFSDSLGTRGRLVGQTEVQYEDVDLSAYAIDLLLDRDEVEAEGLPVDTGMVGRPTFTQGGEEFEGDRLAYNLRSQRGRVVVARTAYDEGNIRAEIAKVDSAGTLYIAGGLYTTCPCVDDPSYSLRSNKMKVVDQDRIFTGPIQLYLFNIPAPLWLPFGYLPAQDGRRSGPLAPQYGEDPSLGFYLRGWGWYFAISEYMDLQLRGGIWTTGSWEAQSTFRYANRYRYSGALSLDYARQRNGESGDPDFSVRRSAQIQWRHEQELSPTANFRSRVNLTSQSHLRTVSESFDDRVRQTATSSIEYSKRWPNAGRRISVRAAQQQVFATRNVNLTLPTISFSQATRQPFERETRPPGASAAWYERLNYSYSLRLSNEFDFNPLDVDDLGDDPTAADIAWYEALFDADAYRRATGEDVPFEFSARHSVPVSAPFTLGRIPGLGEVPLNVSPSFNYTETWFIATERRTLRDDGRIERRQVPGFFALREFSTGVSLNTTAYGTFPLRVGPYDGFRHTLRPSLSFTYRPDFGAGGFGYQRTLVDTTGAVIRYPIVGGVPTGLQQQVGFSLRNTFETRRAQPDTARAGAAPQRRSIVLLNLDANASYNFAADSLRLSSISTTARTNLFGEVDVRANATFSPYAISADSSRAVNRFVAGSDGLRVGRLTRFSLSASTQLASGQRRGPSRPAQASRSFGDLPGSQDLFDDELAQSARLGDPTTFLTPTAASTVDFAIPWSLSLDLAYSISRPLYRTTRAATVNASFTFALTPRWQVRGRTGYDLERGELSTTSFNFLRDFDCWQLTMSWTPLGRYQSYGFELQVKSGQLRDLLRIRQPRQDIRGRFTSVLN